jgi:hypothetical protein
VTLATAFAFAPSQLPPINWPLPKTQGDWQQILNQLATWQQILQGLTQPNTIPVALSKTLTTNRVSTTTLAADPDLTITLPGTGSYSVRTFASIFQNGGGFAFNHSFSGSFTALTNSGMEQFWTHTTGFAAGPYQLQTTPAGVRYGLSAAQIGTFGAVLIQEFVVSPSSAGTLSFNWSQASSDPSNTQVYIGSYMTVQQVG